MRNTVVINNWHGGNTSDSLLCFNGFARVRENSCGFIEVRVEMSADRACYQSHVRLNLAQPIFVALTVVLIIEADDSQCEV